MMKKITTTAVLVLTISGLANAATLWVGTGQTYSDIKTAITAASNGDVIVVKDGVYTGANNRNLNFQGKTITVKSENGPANCTIDCQNNPNSTAFNFDMTGEGAGAILDGFTIINATNNAVNINGGWDGSTCPTIKNCIIKNNSAYLGAGIACIDTTSVIIGCTLSDNSATLGGAINVGGSNDPTIENCIISNNTASESGGGIYCQAYRSPVIKNCLLAGNSAGQKGGAVFCDYGSNPWVINCTIAYNTAGANGGGGVYCYSNTSSSTVPVITNCSFSYNTNFGIYEDGLNADPAVTYCHFYNNSVADFRDYDTWQWTGAADINANITNANNNIDGNPLFVTGPLTDYYLSQTASTQPSNSPCLDAGSDTASNLGLDSRTTRTDGVYDTATVDIGYHHPDAPATLYQLTTSVVSGNGQISPPSGSFAANSVIALTATADAGYRVKQWAGTDNDALKTTANQVTMDADKTVTVEFEAIPEIIYVDDNGPGEPAEDGSLSNPYDTIQQAVDIVPAGGTVIVLDGIYTGTGNNQINFHGKALTLKTQNGPQSCIIDCQFGSQAFYLESGETNDSVIQGFTIKKGYAYQGGAVYLSNADPAIKDCIITESQTYGSNTGGGAIYCSNASPLIENCTFTENYAYHFGGAVLLGAGSAPTIINSIFVSNDAGNAGGGMYITLSSPAIKNSRFTANTAVNAGGAIYSRESSYSVTNCTINNNLTDGAGGGLYCYAVSADIRNSIFTENTNNAISEGDSQSDPNVMYCLFNGNPNGDYFDNDTSTSYSSAVNINTNIPQALNNVDGNAFYAMQGYWDDSNTPTDANDDFWVDGDYHLKAQNGRWNPNTKQWIKDTVTSAGIDAGDPNSDWKKELWPHGKRINAGFYGGTAQASMSDSLVASPSDLDNDDTINEKDLGLFGKSWLNQDSGLLPADISRNGNVDLADFAIFAENW